MISFLKQVSDFIAQEHKNNTENLCVVLPTKRASLFLKKELANTYQSTFWAPTFLSMDEFIHQLSGKNTVNNFELTLHFFKIYQENTNEEEQDNLNDFLNWAPALLADFDSIDRHLVEPNKFFNYISETRALEVWNVDGQALSDFQKEYLRFWKNLSTYYFKLHSELAENQLCTAGQSYRKAAEFDDFENLPYHKIIFAGLNALTPAEEKVIQKALRQGKANILWDSDEYYLQNKNQEAGFFLRQYHQSWATHNFQFKESLLHNDQKNIHIIGCPQNVLQANVAADILKNKIPSNSPQSAVILGDENLLLPLLNQLPEETKNANITMGLPIKQIDLYPLLLQLFSLHENTKGKGKDYLFYHQDLLLFFAHEKIQLLLYNKEKFNELNSYITKNNKIYITQEKCIQILGNEIAFLLHNKNRDSIEFINTALLLISKLKEKFNDNFPIETEYLFAFHTFLQQVQNLIRKFNFKELNTLKTLKRIYIKLIKQEKLSFYGEPLQGLQIMGMLESRALDFENIILLSMNEGVIPKEKSQQSFIPHDIKKEFGLHTYQENDAIYAYHFYRLIQRAKNIYLLYTSASDNFGAQNEKSRFLSQLEMEYFPHNSNVNLTSYQSSISSNSNNSSPFPLLRNTPEVIDRLSKMAQKGFSPTAINNLHTCSSDFYYKRIIGLGEKDEVEEDIQVGSMGTVIHYVLEHMYKPYIGKIVNSEDVKKMQPKTQSLLIEAFEKENISEINTGKNHLFYNVAIDVIDQFLKNEIAFIEDLTVQNQTLSIISLEESVEGEIEITVNDEKVKIHLTGKADRIDKVGNTIRLIDYKTGNVKESGLKLNKMEDIRKEDKSKALQLLWYSMLYLEKHPEISSVSPGIFSFRSLDKGLLQFNYNNESKADIATCHAYKNELRKIFEDLFSVEMEYHHNKNSKYCEYC